MDLTIGGQGLLYLFDSTINQISPSDYKNIIRPIHIVLIK